MKNLLYLLVLITLASCGEDTASERGQTSAKEPIAESVTTPPKALQSIKSVEDIKEAYAYVTSAMQDGSMDSTSFNYNCHDEKKGTVTYFSEEGQLRMIRHTYNEYSHFSAEDNYYVQDEAPFFVLHNRRAWSFVNQNETKDDVTENRIYLVDSKPVKCLQKTFTVYSDSKGASPSKKIASKEVECSSVESVQEDFQLLLKHQNQLEELACLEQE